MGMRLFVSDMLFIYFALLCIGIFFIWAGVEVGVVVYRYPTSKGNLRDFIFFGFFLTLGGFLTFIAVMGLLNLN